MIQNAESTIDTLIRYAFQIGFVCVHSNYKCDVAMRHKYLFQIQFQTLVFKFLLENVTRSLTSVDNWQPLYRLGIRIYRIIEY